MSELYFKHVEFGKWCGSCKYSDQPESEPPCDECLDTPAREGSHRPEKWTPMKGGKGNDRGSMQGLC